MFDIHPEMLPYFPFPNDKFSTSILTEFADDNFKLDENGRKLFKWVENTVEKGEISLSLLCFEKPFLRQVH